MASSNAACPGLPWKPLDTAIGQLLIPDHPSGRQGNSKQKNGKKWTSFAGHFDGHGGAPVHYRMYRLMEEVQGFTRKHWMPPLGEYYGQKHKRDMAMLFFFDVFIVNNLKKVVGRVEGPCFQ
jgi:hypothetical protein